MVKIFPDTSHRTSAVSIMYENKSVVLGNVQRLFENKITFVFVILIWNKRSCNNKDIILCSIEKAHSRKFLSPNEEVS